jgi:hypothetical protein
VIQAVLHLRQRGLVVLSQDDFPHGEILVHRLEVVSTG